MVHIHPDFKTKKAFLEAFKNGAQIVTFNPSGLFPNVQNGTVVIEAPAEYHKWYCKVDIENQVVVKVYK
jgi:hypothetical protein